MRKILILLTTFLLSSCSCYEHSLPSFIQEDINTSTITYNEFNSDDYLITKGKDIVNKKGEKIQLRGVNMGGYSIVEGWMSFIRMKGLEEFDHLKISNTLVDRFGKEKALEFWEEYRNSYYSEIDFINCKNMNMNCLRFPFTYMNVDPLYNNIEPIEGEKYNFRLLDNFIDLASKYGMYTILDLHGAYGSQNGQDHSGQFFENASQVDFYTNTKNQNKTIDLWKAIATRYKDNPAVAAFDILNEPGEKSAATNKKHWDVYDKIYDAIRNIDNERIIIMESCWWADNLPQPSQYNWKNVMYSFHEYTNHTVDSEKHVNAVKDKINTVAAKNFNVPLHMGEFTCYGNEKSWSETLYALNKAGWHWQSWTYKLNKVIREENNPGFGIYYSFGEPIYINDENATFDQLIESLKTFSTTHKNTAPFRFMSGKPLERIIREGCYY